MVIGWNWLLLVDTTDLNNNWTDKLHQVTAASTEAHGSDIP